jgi:multicomponent K+:H+ antiporter subunit E
MRRWLPHRWLWLSLTALWLLLNQSLWIGHVLLGGALGLAACLLYARLEPPRQRSRQRPSSGRWRSVMIASELLAHVALDVLRSNIAVARIVLHGGRRNRTAGFLDIPLELRDPAGLALLACIVTATPGTAWAGHDEERGVLTLHILDLVDEADWIRIIKGRYESRLRELFE